MRKKIIKKICVIVMVFFLFAANAAAENYYISSSIGDDEGAGTENDPWRTIQRLNEQQLEPSDIIYLKRGDTWIGEQLVIQGSGLRETPITFTAYGEAAKPPIIDCNSVEGIGIYGFQKSGITIDGIEIIGWKDFGIYNEFGSNWTVQNCTFESNAVAEDYDEENPRSSACSAIGMIGDAELLRLQNIVIQNNTIGNMMPVDFGCWDTWVSDCYSWVYYKGISVYAADNVLIYNNDMDLGGYTGGIAVSSSSNVTVDSNRMANTYSCVYFHNVGGEDSANAITNNHMINNVSTCIDVRAWWGKGDGWNLGGSTLIGWNEIHGGTGSGITALWRDNLKIVYNLVYDKDFYTIDGVPSIFNGIDINHSCNDGSMYHNTVYSVAGVCATLEAFGVWPCMNWTMKNNIFDASDNKFCLDPERGGSKAFYYEYSDAEEDVDININSDNNIFRPFGSADPIAVNIGAGAAMYPISEWQILLRDTFGQEDWDENSLDVDPKFTDPTNYVFSLKHDSPCIDAGANLSSDLGCTGGIDCYDLYGTICPIGSNKSGGSQWDIGAYEYNSDQADSDGDGISDTYDNCPASPNGPEGGTCICGNEGELCMSNGDCGDCGFCGMNQEDTDSDGIGDVCDPSPYAALCQEYCHKCKSCRALQDAGCEVDYNVCKKLSSRGQTACEAAGCTWYKNSPTQAYPCMLDMCLMDWDGNNGVGALDDGIFRREMFRYDCSTTYQAETNLCQMYYNKHQSCLALQDAGREVDYDVCKKLSSQGQTACEAAGCTWYNNSPTQAYPCMLDMCLMDWDGYKGVTILDIAIYKREQGRSCP